MTRPRILLIDDHARFRDHVEQFLSADFDVTAREDACDIVADFDQLRAPRVVMDIWMEKLDGFAAARLLKSERPAACVVFLSSDGRSSSVRAAFAAGGCAYVVKASAYSDLRAALAAASRGEQFVSPALELR